MGKMKTTLEIPDKLMQRVRLRAVRRNQKLKDTVAQLLEIGMSAAPDAVQTSAAPKPLKLKRNGLVDIHSIEAAIACRQRPPGRLPWNGRLAESLPRV